MRSDREWTVVIYHKCKIRFVLDGKDYRPRDFVKLNKHLRRVADIVTEFLDRDDLSPTQEGILRLFLATDPNFSGVLDYKGEGLRLECTEEVEDISEHVSFYTDHETWSRVYINVPNEKMISSFIRKALYDFEESWDGVMPDTKEQCPLMRTVRISRAHKYLLDHAATTRSAIVNLALNRYMEKLDSLINDTTGAEPASLLSSGGAEEKKEE